MNLQHNRKSFTTNVATPVLIAVLGPLAGLSATGCSSDEVGRTKTTEKRVIDTPTEKTTITETHEKETKYVPR